jgi:hypothetical protein
MRFRVGSGGALSLSSWKMKIYVSPVSGWQSGVLGFDSLHPLQSSSLNTNNLQQRKLRLGEFPERFLKDFPRIPGQT